MRNLGRRPSIPLAGQTGEEDKEKAESLENAHIPREQSYSSRPVGEGRQS